MNSERNILSRLLEGSIEVERPQDLDEKTYTVGDTQYWKRGGKCYSWTQSGGRKECTEEEYMKAISGGSGGSPKSTPSDQDASKKSNEPTQTSKEITADWRLVHDAIGEFGDRTYAGQQFSLKTPERVNDAHLKVVDAIKSRGFEVESEKEYEYVGDIVPMKGGKFKITTFRDSEGNEFSVRSRTGGREKQILQLHNGESDMDSSHWKELEPSKSNDAKLDKDAVESAKKEADALRYHGHKNLRFFSKNGDVTVAKSTDEFDYLESNGWSEVDGKDIGYEAPKSSEKSPIEKSKDRQRRDPNYSSRHNYQGVSDFDHTTWDIDGYETTIQETEDGYYLQNEDFDMEFPTQSDLINYLRDNQAEFVGNDSENDY